MLQKVSEEKDQLSSSRNWSYIRKGSLQYLVREDSQDDLRVRALVQQCEAGSYFHSQGPYSETPFHDVTLTEAKQNRKLKTPIVY